MRIITDTKLDFHDVLIQPKRSTLGSRDEVELDSSIAPMYGKVFLLWGLIWMVLVHLA